MNQLVFDWRNRELSKLPLVDRPSIQKKATAYIREVQEQEHWKLSHIDIDVFCKKQERNEGAKMLMPTRVDGRLFHEYAMVYVIPKFVDAYGFEWYKSAIRHELAHIESAIVHGVTNEDSPEFISMLEKFGAPKTINEIKPIELNTTVS